MKLSQRKAKILAGNCKEAREAVGISGEDASARLGKSVSYVWQLERGTFQPALAVLLQLRKIYKTKLSRLLRGL